MALITPKLLPLETEKPLRERLETLRATQVQNKNALLYLFRDKIEPLLPIEPILSIPLALRIERGALKVSSGTNSRLSLTLLNNFDDAPDETINLIRNLFSQGQEIARLEQTDKLTQELSSQPLEKHSFEEVQSPREPRTNFGNKENSIPLPHSPSLQKYQNELDALLNSPLPQPVIPISPSEASSAQTTPILKDSDWLEPFDESAPSPIISRSQQPPLGTPPSKPPSFYIEGLKKLPIGSKLSLCNYPDSPTLCNYPDSPQKPLKPERSKGQDSFVMVDFLPKPPDPQPYPQPLPAELGEDIIVIKKPNNTSKKFKAKRPPPLNGLSKKTNNCKKFLKTLPPSSYLEGGKAFHIGSQLPLCKYPDRIPKKRPKPNSSGPQFGIFCNSRQSKSKKPFLYTSTRRVR